MAWLYMPCPHNYCTKTKECMHENAKKLRDSCLACLIFANTVYFLSYAWRRRKKKQKEERKKEERRLTKSKFWSLVFSTLLKVSSTFRVDLALEYQRDVACKLFALLCWFLFGNCPYTICTGGHFQPASSLTNKYYHTSWYYKQEYCKKSTPDHILAVSL